MFAAATLGYNFSLVSSGFILNGNASGLPRATLAGSGAATAFTTIGGVNAANAEYFALGENSSAQWLGTSRFALGGEFTIAFWAKSNAATPGGTLYDLGGAGATGTAPAFTALTLDASGTGAILATQGSGALATATAAAGAFPADGNWYFYAVVHGASTQTLYRVASDGSLTTLASSAYDPAGFALNPADASETYDLGNDGPTGADTPAWNGGIDYFSIHTGAFTATQLAELRVAAEASYALNADSISVDVGNAGQLFGTPGADVLDGRDGADYLVGGAGNDTLVGGLGDDTLQGDSGADSMTGGDGQDVYVVDNTADLVTEAVAGGADTAYVGVDGYTLAANVEIARLFGAATIITGSAGDEQIVGNSAANSVLNGGAGDDVLWGTGRTDVLDGGDGRDIFRGGGGPDSYVGGRGDDDFVVSDQLTSITELADGGTDTVWSTAASYTLSAHIEIGRLSAAGATYLEGSSGDDQLVTNGLTSCELRGADGDDVLWGFSGISESFYGGDGNDVIRGGGGRNGGNDTAQGGRGDDHYVLTGGGAAILELEGEGYDTVWNGQAANTAFTLATNVERVNLSGLANRAQGNAGDNVMVGDAVACQLDGVAGNDTLYGSAFADTLTGGTGDDVIYAGGGADRIVFQNTGWGVDQIAGFSQAAGARLDVSNIFRGIDELVLSFGNGNTQVTAGADIILVFGATLTAADFIFFGA